MSLAIWPPISPEELKLKVAETLVRRPPSYWLSSFSLFALLISFLSTMLIRLQNNELAWITTESLEVCRDLKHGLEDCYALLAPVDPGSTLVMSTPRNEKVKGTITRVGTRLVKGVSPATRPLSAQEQNR